MHVILTHEQADFDALASLLAAGLLNSQAVAVLPRRMNRNARSFMNLYGADLPFVDARDLPPGPVERVTLVDTQSLVTLKGFTDATEVHVIDHHPKREDLNPDWQVVIEKVGATTTFLVELLREHNGHLTALQATLLLLGIYEDTGSLTYVSTTTRDVRAAAYLLEQGASLRIAGKYLNPPLSPEQRQLYEALSAAANSYQIQGQHIVIAAAEAEEMTEEVSSVAHKLRDLLDPDALFLLVSTGEGVRLVARSTTDAVDVSRVAAHFGGGGHDRAAAALINRDELVRHASPLQAVQDELLSILPDVIHPPVTVGQIMSTHPLLLTPETSVQEAAELMRRFGYEGYPVVKSGKVVGLLPRRAVDRALSHRLNLNAASLMEAGEVVVRPGDALDHLQRLMASTGWGQVPVIDEQTEEVIGIVTRTDLLKTIGTGEMSGNGKKNIASRLEAALPPARLALLKQVAGVAAEKRLPVYIVGGFVRDLLLNRPSLDFDIVVEGDAIHLARSLERAYGGRVVTHRRFGTAKWKLAGARLDRLGIPADEASRAALPESLDLISARTEFYEKPTALPVVETGSIKLDLHRRDFTINTLALRLDGRHYGELYDYWGGLNDIEKGLVRVLHSISFIDDPTRMLRAVRFEIRFGFRIEDRTLELVDEAAPLLKQVSGDRLRHELDLILTEEKAPDMLQRLDQLGLLKCIHPGLRWDASRRPLLEQVRTAPLDERLLLPDTVDNQPIRRILAYLVWLLPMEAEDARDLAARLRFPRHLREGLASGSQLWNELGRLAHQKPGEITRRLETVSNPVLYALCLLRQAEPERAILERYLTHWQHVRPVTDGIRLRELGLRPSPLYKQILARLRAAYLDGEIASADQEEALLQRLLAEADASDGPEPD